MTIDGVLRKVKGETPIPTGLELYRSLAQTWHIVLLSDFIKDYPPLDMFLNVNGVIEQVKTIGVDSMTTWLAPPERRLEQVNLARASGQNVQLVIEPDPAVSARLIDNGYNVCTFTPAEYTVPSWRPDYRPSYETDDGPQYAMPWDKLSKSIAEQARLKAEDDRLKDEQSPTHYF
jgi:hypothetical protein